MKTLVWNVLSYRLLRSPSDQKLEDDCSNRIDIANFWNPSLFLELFLEQKFLDFIGVLFDLSVLVRKNFSQLSSYGQLFWSNKVDVSSPYIIKRKVVIILNPKIHVGKNFLGLPRAVVQVSETESAWVIVLEEYVLGVQISMNDVLRVKELKKVNDFNHYLDGL